MERSALEGRYNDLKEILTAVYEFWGPRLSGENEALMAMEMEFEMLADQLDLEHISDLINRLF